MDSTKSATAILNLKMKPRTIIVLVVLCCIMLGAEIYHVVDYAVYAGKRDMLIEQERIQLQNEEAFLKKKIRDHDSAMVEWWGNETFRLEMIQKWNTVEAREDSIFKAQVRRKLRLPQQMSIFDFFQLNGNKTASESGYMIVIGALVTVIGVLARVIVVLYRDKKETDKVMVGLVEDNITSNKEMTATFQALKPFIRT